MSTSTFPRGNSGEVPCPRTQRHFGTAGNQTSNFLINSPLPYSNRSAIWPPIRKHLTCLRVNRDKVASTERAQMQSCDFVESLVYSRTRRLTPESWSIMTDLSAHADNKQDGIWLWPPENPHWGHPTGTEEHLSPTARLIISVINLHILSSRGAVSGR